MSYALFNGSYIGSRNTGIGVVARELSHSLSPEKFKFLIPFEEKSHKELFVPPFLSPEYGLKGHYRRINWVQNSLPRLIKSLKAEFVFSPLPEAPIFKNVRSVVLAHDLIPLRFPSFTFLTPYYLTYVPIVLHQASAIICNSKSTANELNLYFKIPFKKLFPVKLGFDNTHLRSLELSREDFFLVLGRHNPHKNLKRIIKAFSMFKKKQYKLILVGPFDKRYTPKLQKYAQDLGLSGRCIWKDWVDNDEKNLLLNTCRTLVIASLWEGFGLPALEAMACGTPVIASKYGALSEILDGDGIYVDPYRIDSITEAMYIASESNAFNNNFSNKLIERSSLFNWNSTAKEIERILFHL